MRPALHVISWPGPGRLATMAHPRGGPWLADEMAGLARAGVDVFVSALTWEEDRRLGLTEVAAAATAAGVEFVSFPIADRGVPRAKDIEAFRTGPAAEDTDIVALGVRLAAHVRAGRFVVTQCFAGIGRSTLLACTTLVMLGIGPEPALRMVAEARGLPVPDTDAQRHWLYEFAAAHGG
jgi:protein-tyrosine phosphatase